MQELLTDEQAAAIWAGETSSILNLEEDSKKEIKVEDKEEETVEVEEVKLPFTEDDITKALSGELPEEDDEEEEVEEVKKNTKEKEETAEKKAGRKPTDLVNLINQLVEEEELSGFEEGEVKTIEDAKELIKLNLKAKEESSSDKWWESKVSNYSPQIQAILHYAEQGGEDVKPLLNAIAQVEEVVQLDISTEDGQVAVVTEVLKLKGFDDEEIKDQIETLKDLDKLKIKAEKFQPELNKMKEQRVQMILAEEEERNQEAKEASKIYLNTIKSTLDKDDIQGFKLQREDKAKIFESLAVANHTSLNGNKTNNFVKTLEELQFGKQANYDRFLNIVRYTVDEEGFMKDLKQKIKNELAEVTYKKLKSAKTTTPTSEEEAETVIKKNTVSKNTFKNPYK